MCVVIIDTKQTFINSNQQVLKKITDRDSTEN